MQDASKYVSSTTTLSKSVWNFNLIWWLKQRIPLWNDDRPENHKKEIHEGILCFNNHIKLKFHTDFDKIVVLETYYFFKCRFSAHDKIEI